MCTYCNSIVIYLSSAIQRRTKVINARRACARGLQYFVRLSVCQSPGFFSHLYDKSDIFACSSLVFLGFQLIHFDKTVSFVFFSALSWFGGRIVLVCVEL